MAVINKKRVGIEQVKSGMILGDDVINSNGMILIPKNTVINQKHIFRLKLYQVLSIIVNVENEESLVKENYLNIKTSSSEDAYFSKFKSTYTAKEKEIKKQIHLITNGDSVDPTQLYSITSSLLHSIRTKSDVFNYLYHLEQNDEYTYTHSLNVSLLCNIFGHWLQLTDQQLETITVAGLLHDIGMMRIDQNLLNKTNRLSSEEYETIQKHPIIGYEILKDAGLPFDICYGTLMHHERIDGSGYPRGLTNSEIHDYAKIISIVDIYDAMTSNRSYHERFSPFKVIQMFEQESYGILDTKFLYTFLQNIAHNYLGEMIRLSTGEEAKVIFIHNQNPSRPIVQIGNDMVDLMVEPTVTIEEII